MPWQRIKPGAKEGKGTVGRSWRSRTSCAPTAATRPRGIDPRGEGQLLWPTLFPEEEVRKLESVLGTAGPGQLQQRPSPLGGGMFKRVWFPVLPDMPTDVQYWVRFWDCAGTEGGGDWTAGALVGKRRSGGYVIAGMVHGQWSSGNVDKVIDQTAASDTPRVKVREEQEPGSAGKSVIAARTLRLAGYDYRGIPSTGSKEVRWQPLAVQAEAGNVVLVAGPWVEKFLGELEQAPFGSHDDQLDAAAGGFNEVALKTGESVAAVTAYKRR